MTRLLDIGIDSVRNIIFDMAKISENCVFTAIETYERGNNTKMQIYEWSEKLRMMQDEVSDLAIELIARYQPVASDLRFIRSCLEIAYVFTRFGRYSWDIVDVFESLGSVTDCDKSEVIEMTKTVREMILLSVNSLQSRDKNAVKKLYEMDDVVDSIYKTYLKKIATLNVTVKDNNITHNEDVRCYISTTLILKYLERISDHACYIGDSVYYFVTGSSKPRH